MGTIHKLKPEVLNFILENKKNNSALSCRDLTNLVLEKLQIKVSKSSINTIFKENNLSLPMGRRPRKKRKKLNLPVLPIIESSPNPVIVTPSDPSLRGHEVPEAIQSSKIIQPQDPELEKEKIDLEQERIKEAEAWALKLQEEERNRLEQERLAREETHKKALEETQRQQAEEAAKQERLRLEEEKAALESGLKAEREKWARLAEEELKAKQQAAKETVLPSVTALPQGSGCSGLIFLKALDYLIGASDQINEIISKELGNQPEKFLNLTEAIIFRQFLGKDNLCWLRDLTGIQYSPEELDNYYAQIRKIKDIRPNILRIISGIFTEAQGVKVHFIDGNMIFLDAQLRSAWPTAHIPHDFSNTLYDLKNNLNRHFFQNHPLVLFSAPDNDIISKEFFNLLLNIGLKNKCPDTLTLYGKSSEELDNIFLNQENSYSLIFGLWPWQFTACRKVKKIGDFNLKHVAGIDKDLYLAEVEIELFQASLNQSIILKGCAVKTNPAEKILLAILACGKEELNLEKLAEIYLGRWPDFEGAFQDFSRKIELFAYAGNTQKFFSTDNLRPYLEEPAPELEDIFANYIKMLDVYLRWYFLPKNYQDKDFSLINKCFYKIPAELIPGKDGVKVEMQIGPEYQFLKDLKYLIGRLNERQVKLANGKLLYFENVFK